MSNVVIFYAVIKGCSCYLGCDNEDCRDKLRSDAENCSLVVN